MAVIIPLAVQVPALARLAGRGPISSVLLAPIHPVAAFSEASPTPIMSPAGLGGSFHYYKPTFVQANPGESAILVMSQKRGSETSYFAL